MKQAVDPPHMTAMQAAWAVLEDLGAVDEGGRLTGLGRHIVRQRCFILVKSS